MPFPCFLPALPTPLVTGEVLVGVGLDPPLLDAGFTPSSAASVDAKSDVDPCSDAARSASTWSARLRPPARAK